MKIKYFGNPAEDICELEEARYLLNFDQRIVTVEGQQINSFEELVQLISLDRFKDKNFIEVVLLPTIMGG